MLKPISIKQRVKNLFSGLATHIKKEPPCRKHGSEETLFMLSYSYFPTKHRAVFLTNLMRDDSGLLRRDYSQDYSTQ